MSITFLSSNDVSGFEDLDENEGLLHALKNLINVLCTNTFMMRERVKGEKNGILVSNSTEDCANKSQKLCLLQTSNRIKEFHNTLMNDI